MPDYYSSILKTAPITDKGKILVTGATGYIGGRLVPDLIERGYKVKVLVRHDSPIYNLKWPGAEIVYGDALDPSILNIALKDVYAAYYLIHSMNLGYKCFNEVDLEIAKKFRLAAEKAKIKRIIYLSGLGNENNQLSKHLQSRYETAEELEKGKVPVTVLKSAIILGSGSASFEIIHNLVKNLSIMPISSWASNKCQPIGIRNAIQYLVGALETPETSGKRFDIGGKDILTYKEIIETMGEVLNKKVKFIKFPFTSMRLYSYFTSLFTPVPAPITHCLLYGLKNEVICKDDEIKKLIQIQLLTCKESMTKAVDIESKDLVDTRWSDATFTDYSRENSLKGLGHPPKFTAASTITSKKRQSDIFKSVCNIGGKTGWGQNNWLWRLRGVIDKLLLGVGTQRGRKSHSSLRLHDVVDFWRVEDIRYQNMLLLRAEMKIPGEAWLKFNITHKGTYNIVKVQAYFDTTSPFGKLYWYSMVPFHYFLFKNLLKLIEKKA